MARPKPPVELRQPASADAGQILIALRECDDRLGPLEEPLAAGLLEAAARHSVAVDALACVWIKKALALAAWRRGGPHGG